MSKLEGSLSKRIKINKEKLYNLYITKKLSSKEIGKMFNCSYSTISSQLREFGIPIRDRSEAHKGCSAWNKRDDINREELYNLYVEKKISSAKIGKIFNCKNVAICNKLREFGIPIRDLSEAHIGQVAWNKRDDINKEELYNLYVEKKMSSAKVGKIFNCGNVVVCSKFREFRIPIRPRKLDIKKEQLQVLYITKKLSSADIGKILNCDATTVCRRLREFRIPIRSGEELVKACLTRRTPSSLEVKFQNIIDKHDLPYKYVGDGSFILGSYNPDFINTNKEKVAVEVYARYYKRRNKIGIEEWKKKRSEVFASYGWKLLFFNEIQVNEKNVLKVLR